MRYLGCHKDMDVAGTIPGCPFVFIHGAICAKYLQEIFE
jgi:hypothetical protein